MAEDNISEGDPEVEGEEFEGEDAEQPVLQSPVRQELPPESDGGSKKKVKGKRKKPPPPIRINLSNCKYEVLRIVQRKLGWKEVGDDEDWEIYWTDTSVSIERIMKLTRIQKINHFSGMLEICRKRAMARNLMKMARMFPQHYDFFPRTFILPGDREDFMADIRARGKKQVYILKPDAGCQGRGIRLVQGGKDEVVARVLSEMATPNVVAQHYMSSPLLIHGYKFDLRIYALVLSCDPLRVFLFHEGLARICTEKYSAPKASNLDVAFMHLTNYAVNKKNEAFVAAVAASADSGEDASKWCLAQLRQYLTSQGYDWSKIWADIGDLIIKSLCSVQPVLRNNYRSVLPPDNDGFSCFEILGYDIMLDDSLRPWLIEVNHSPSFNIDSPLDLAIKEELISQTIELVRVDPKIIAKTKKAERRAATSRLLEPMHAKKAQVAAGGRTSAPSGGAGGGAQGDSRDRERTGGGESEEGGGGSSGAAPSSGFVKPRTPEEYEAWRAKVLAARERYEAKHSGNFTRIFPSPDPAKQALYEELLKGAGEIYQASFQARSKRLEAAEEKKRKEDAETDAQKAERLKARAHRDKLAQMAVERRKIKLLQQQAMQGGQLLPAYLMPPPQPYLQPAGGGLGAGSVQPSSTQAVLLQQLQQQQQQLQMQQGVYYVPLMPMGPYQYDPAVYQQYYYQQQSYLYGGGGGSGPPARLSEVYGERSDGGPSAASSRPASAFSNSSHVAVDPLAPPPGQVADPRGPPRVQVGPVARAVASASREHRAASPVAGAGAGGLGGPMGLPGSGAAGGGSLVQGLQQQVLLQSGHGHAYQQMQQPTQPTHHSLLLLLQQQQQLAHQQALHQQQQTQGALPPNPFLGGSSRRPSSATSRTSTGGGCGTGLAASAGAGGNGFGGGGDAPDGLATVPGRGGAAGYPHPASPSAALPAGAPATAAAVAGSRLLLGSGGGGSHSFSHGNSTPIQQLQQQSVAAAPAASGAAAQPQPVRAVAVGSAHNHVRHAHGSAAETSSAAPAGPAGGGPEHPELWKIDRDPQSGLGPGPGAGPGPGPGRGALLNGSRPPSASSVPASIRDKLQPHFNPSTAGAGAAAAGAASGTGAASPATSAGAGAAAGLIRKQSIAALLNNSTATAAATWDAAMAAAAVAAGHEPDSFAQYLGGRPRPRSAGQGLRPTSAGGGAGASQRSPSPLVASPPAASTLAAALAALSAPGGSSSGASAPAAGRNGAERTGTGSADMFLLGLAHALGHAPPSPPQQSRQSGSSSQVLGGGGGAPPAPMAPGSPVIARSGSSGLGAPSQLPPPTPATGGYSGAGGAGASSVGATGAGASAAAAAAAGTRDSASPAASLGRAFKQTRAPGAAGMHTAVSTLVPGAGLVHVGRFRGEEESQHLADETVAAVAPVVYQPLVMPDTGPGSGPMERKQPGSSSGSRLWPASSPTGSAASAGSARQRSFNSGAGGGYGPPASSAVPPISSGSGGGPAGVAGVLTSRPPVYPPPGGSPGIRAGGAPVSGRAGGGGAGGSAGVASAKLSGSGVSSARLNQGYAGAFSSTGAVAHPGLAGGGSVMGRAVGGVGPGGGTASGLTAMQEGLEGLQITATGVEMNSQLRSAALAALNRKGLAVKGKKVAQQ